MKENHKNKEIDVNHDKSGMKVMIIMNKFTGLGVKKSVKHIILAFMISIMNSYFN